jgi:acetylxylan esterase
MFSQIICALVLSLAVIGETAMLQPVTFFGDNPTKLSMNIYVPDKLASKPPVIIVVSGIAP